MKLRQCLISSNKRSTAATYLIQCVCNPMLLKEKMCITQTVEPAVLKCWQRKLERFITKCLGRVCMQTTSVELPSVESRRLVEHKLLSNTLIIVFLQGKDSYGYISPPELIVIDKLLQTDKVWPVSHVLMSPVSLSRFVCILQDKVGVRSHKVRTDLSWQPADLDLAPVPSCGASDTHPHPEHSSGVGQRPKCGRTGQGIKS